VERPARDRRLPAPPADLRDALLAHYDRHARPLPWRADTDPYRVWVSEVMLQQTRVETVVPYYQAWMRRFPTLETLADAPEEAVLKAWEGLGYYRRARNLARGARVVRERFGGRLPADVGDLRSIPGVGEYTAGAVASIAFGRPEPAVDGNVRRVLARLCDRPEPTAGWLRDTASTLVCPERPGDFNQALMELGATLCTPRRPACGDCPWSGWCRARAAGTQEARPLPGRRAPVPLRRIDCVVVVRGANHRSAPRLLVRRRSTEGLLGGLWEFPERVALPGIARGVPLDPVRHTFTHFRAEYRPALVRVEPSAEVAVDAAAGPTRWVTPAAAARLALPVTQRRILQAALAVLTEG